MERRDRMRRLYILLFCSLLIAVIGKSCFSEEVREPRYDGYTWESWSEDFMKLGWVAGFSNGLLQVVSETPAYFLGCARDMKLESTGTIEGAEELGVQLIKDFKDMIYWGEGTTIGQMVTGLDKFYKDYRNKTILMREATYIVKLEVMGAPQEFIEQVTRILRMSYEERDEEHKSLLGRNREYKEAYNKWGKYFPLGIIYTMWK
jgi:hypothetical protein